jgi:8-oxo-dGTP diphosphatase
MATDNPPLVRESVLVDAPARTVAAALAEPWLLRRGLDRIGVRLGRVDGEQLGAGDELTLTALGLSMRLRVTRADEQDVVLVTLGGGPRVRVHATVGPTGDGTLVSCGVGCSWHGVGPGRRRLTRLVRGFLADVRTRSEQLRTAPVVVGAAIVADGRVLTAQRDRPPAAAGRWEFPGGKVEPGEDERAALARECEEELAADVCVGDRLGPDLVLANGWVLRLYLARLADGALPVAAEHRQLRWVPVDRLSGVDWLPADRIVVPGLAVAMRLVRLAGVNPGR